MKPTVCGEEIPDWFYRELLIRFGEPVTINHVVRALLDDYLRRNAPSTNRWDEPKNERHFWDPNIRPHGAEHTATMSDLDLIKNPSLGREREIFDALFNIVIELTEKINAGGKHNA